MATLKLDGNVIDQEGRAVSGAIVYVYDQEGGLATLTDAGGGSLSNPVVADEDGYWSAYVSEEGFYTLEFFWQGRKRLIEANRIAGRAPLEELLDIAAAAEAAGGQTYGTIPDGLAATTDGQSFAVGNGDGTVSIYLNDAGGAVLQRQMATTLALASNDNGKGASLIGLESGATVQDIESGDANKGASLVALEDGGSAQMLADYFTATPGTLDECKLLTFPAWIKFIRTSGHSDIGDGGDGFYAQVASDPGHPGAWQDAGGTWFELIEAKPAIEQFGAKGDAQTETTSGVITTCTGTGNADALDAAFAYATAKKLARVVARGSGPFGIERPVIITTQGLCFGDGTSPESLFLIALSSGTWAEGDNVIATQANRVGLVGMRVIVPTGIYMGNAGIGTAGVGTKINPVATLNGSGGTLYFHNRLHNVDAIGGYKAFNFEAIEGDIQKTRAGGYMIGYDVSGADNFFHDCTASILAAALPPHADNIGCRTTAGIEGEIHCVRNRINYEFNNQKPIKFTGFDDTPYEVGCFFNTASKGAITMYHTRTGEMRVDPATEKVYLYRFINGGQNHIICAGVVATPSPATNIFMMETSDGGTAETDGAASINTFENFHFDFNVGENQFQRRQARRSHFAHCSGNFVGRYCSNNGAGLGPKYTGTAGAAMVGPGGENVSIYLDRNYGTDANRVLRAELTIHFRKGAAEDCVCKTWIRIGAGTEAGNNVASPIVEVAKLGASDYTTATISGISYTPGARRVDFTLTAPTGFAATCEVVRGQVVTANGAYS